MRTLLKTSAALVLVGFLLPPLAPAQDVAPPSEQSAQRAPVHKRQDPPAKPGVVCLKLAMQCFERKVPPTADTQQLDITAPDVRTLIPTRELQAMMTDQEEDPAEAPNSVKVEGRPTGPQVPSGFAGLWWAAKNPLQAWRLFTPVQ